MGNALPRRSCEPTMTRPASVKPIDACGEAMDVFMDAMASATGRQTSDLSQEVRDERYDHGECWNRKSDN
jgi:hypothetical protein